MSKQITNKPFIQKKSKSHQVTPREGLDGVYEVNSGSSGETYFVVINENGATCNCKWGYYRKMFDPRSGCSHAVSVYRYRLAQEENRSLSVWTSEEDAARQKRQTIDIGDGVLITTRKS